MNVVTLPLYNPLRRFERLADELLGVAEAAPAGPAYDIRKTGDNAYVLHVAVPGYAEKDLSIVAQDRVLTVSGKVEAVESEGWIRRGIARESFERRFALGEHVQVKAAKLENGILTVELAREVPEAMKPRTIAIGAQAA
ncbi:MAG: Hsp20 family protein [Geminicoccaceae bacterium]